MVRLLTNGLNSVAGSRDAKAAFPRQIGRIHLAAYLSREKHI